jgi:hypothetical protein
MLASALAKYNSGCRQEIDLALARSLIQNDSTFFGDTSRRVVVVDPGSDGLVRIASPRDNISAKGRRLCRIENTGSTATRITARNGRGKSPERSRREMKPSVRGGFKCLERAPSLAALNAERFCNQSENLCNNVPSVASHFTLASSARTSILQADLSARNPFPHASRGKMRSINVRFIPSA